ncbi:MULTISPECIES: hypothetical protein [unclassified Bifidobacterium]|uniref:hypothetical protein n=1 Tax=unclassified Bifidobacterium TaxID=2608897 RepID=UPI0011279B55|nr:MULTISPECIES: hypothetical protein [unclassified Bifidobacterium]
MSKWNKAARLVSGVRDGLALLDDDERRRAIEALRSIVYEDMFGTGSQELPADACVRCGSIGIVRGGIQKAAISADAAKIAAARSRPTSAACSACPNCRWRRG